MFPLRLVLCGMLLAFSLSIGPALDIGLDSRMNTVEQKRRALLKSLNEYQPDKDTLTHKPKHNSSRSIFLSPILSTTVSPVKEEQTLVRKPDNSLVPGSESIKNYDDYYRVMYGTPEGISFLRKNFGPTGLQRARSMYNGVDESIRETQAAQVHYYKVMYEAKCRVPQKQVICVKDYYPDVTKTYHPRCTILHRCGNHTGCCALASYQCVPTAMQEVSITFFFTQMVRYGNLIQGTEKLLFDNHTSCACQPINDMPRMMDDRTPLDGKESSSTTECQECPVPFTSRMYNDSRCGCDCFDKEKPCLKIKRGREPLREIERRCVESHHCNIPLCEYGEYNTSTGYCPRKHGQKRPHPRRGDHLHPNHRWTYLERD